MPHDVTEQHAVISVSGPKVQLSARRFSIREGLNQLFSARVIANSNDPNIDLEKIVGHPALFQLSGGQLHAQYGTRRWTGVVAHAEQVHVDPTNTGESTYYFHIVPTFWLTQQRRETRIFQHLKIPDIIKTILDEWGIESLNELNGFYREHEYIVQYNETDFDFINRLCEWAGITYYFKFQVQETTGWEHGTKTKPREEKKKRLFGGKSDPEADKEREAEEKRDKANRAADANMHAGWTTINEPGEPDDAIHEDDKQQKPAAAVGLKLAFSDGVHENEARQLPIHYVDQPNEAAQEEFLTECRLLYNVAPGRHTIRDFDYRSKLDYQLFGKEKKPAAVPEDFYEQYHYQPGAFKAEADAAELAVGDKPKGYRHLQKEIGEPMAERRHRIDRTDRRVMRFVTNCVDLGPGVVFTMTHHPRADMDLKKYLIRKFTLEGFVNDKWTYEGEAQYQEDPFYPELCTPKPRIRGLQSAVVTGPDGKEEIFCDELGRVKVQFHWDRDGQYDDKSSCWVRVSHDWAGTGFGTQFLPRIGQEVLVSFLEGDPDLPIIVGRAYNGINKVPYELPTFKERSSWKTDSTPSADGFSEITFEDRKDQEKIFVQSETDTQKLVKQYETHRIGNDLMTVVGEHRTSVVSKLDALMIGERYLLRSIKAPKEERNEKGKVKKGDDLQIPTLEQPSIEPLKTAVEMMEKRIIFTTGAATVAFVDKDIRIEADGNIHVKAKGADCIIEGKKVHLNPGSPPPNAPKTISFNLPKHDGWKRHAADLLDELSQKMKRGEITTPELEAPKPPSFVGDELNELHKCFLMATLVHCMHPSAPREPCQDENRDDFHRLEVVPDPPTVPGRTPGMEGQGERGAASANVPDVLVKPGDKDDPRQRYNWKGEAEEGGKYVKKSGDVITLKSKVHDNCGKHTSWRATGFQQLKTHEGEDWFVEVPGWIHSRTANWEFTTADLLKVADAWNNKDADFHNYKTKKAVGLDEAEEELRQAKWRHRDGNADLQRDLDQAQRKHDLKKDAYDQLKKDGKKWELPVQVRVKGLSWTSGVSPRRYDISASACSGPSHKYSILSYPNDKFSIDFGFGKAELFDPLGTWLKSALPSADTPIGEFALAINTNVYFGGNAQWKENKRDHRAYYAYQLKLSADPLFSISGSYALHLYHVLAWIPLLQPVGIAARAFKRFFDVAIRISLTGQIKGELTFERIGPDDLKGDWAGKIIGEIILSLAADAFFIKKEIAGAGIGGQTSFILTGTPKQDRSPMDPPTMIANGEWKNFTVSMYWGIKFLRKTRTIQVADPKKFGPWEVKPMTWVNRTLDSKYKEL